LGEWFARGREETLLSSLRPRDEKLIVDLTGGSLVCERVAIADRPRKRMRGLLGKSSLPPGEGMLLQPAPSIHTLFMRFPIDAVFVDGSFRVVKIVTQLQSWRVASARRARAVLELAAGEASRRKIKVGDELGIVDPRSPLSAASRADRLRPDDGTEAGPIDGAGCPADRGGDGAWGTANRAVEPLRVLIIAADRRFRAVAGTLLAHRGYAVVLGGEPDSTVRLARREGVDVVVLDAGHSLTAAVRVASQLGVLEPQVGIVLVGEEPEAHLSGIAVVPKWDSFGRLCDAIERARSSDGQDFPCV
jgi:uncharacterized protein